MFLHVRKSISIARRHRLFDILNAVRCESFDSLERGFAGPCAVRIETDEHIGTGYPADRGNAFHVRIEPGCAHLHLQAGESPPDGVPGRINCLVQGKRGKHGIHVNVCTGRIPLQKIRERFPFTARQQVEHRCFHGETRHPLMSINDVFSVARGEGLDYLSFCGEIVDQHAYADWRDAGRPDDAMPDGVVEAADFVCSVSHEVTQDLLGHMCLVNAPGHVKPGHPWWITPTNAEMIEQVRKGECGTLGATVMAHPYDGLTEQTLLDVLADPERTGLGRELPVDAALGLADTMDFIVPGHSLADLELRFRDYVRLLNLGLRIGVSASSDAYADQGTEIAGSVRTVVQADAFTMNAIAQGYRRQKTIATNGPLLMLSVNGQGIGDTVPGPNARIVARAYSNWGLSRLEVIAGGETIAEATPGADGWTVIEREVAFDRSQWLVARVSGPAHPALNVVSVPEAQRSAHGQHAITSPIFVSVPGKPIVPRSEDAQYFIQWIDACCQAIRKRKDVLQGKGPYGPRMKESHVTTALKLFLKARAVYERLLQYRMPG